MRPRDRGTMPSCRAGARSRPSSSVPSAATSCCRTPSARTVVRTASRRTGRRTRPSTKPPSSCTPAGPDALSSRRGTGPASSGRTGALARTTRARHRGTGRRRAGPLIKLAASARAGSALLGCSQTACRGQSGRPPASHWRSSARGRSKASQSARRSKFGNLLPHVASAARSWTPRTARCGRA